MHLSMRLLPDVRELVYQQVQTPRGLRLEGAGPEHEVPAERERLGLELRAQRPLHFQITSGFIPMAE